MNRIILMAAALLCLLSPAEARHRHRPVQVQQQCFLFCAAPEKTVQRIHIVRHSNRVHKRHYRSIVIATSREPVAAMGWSAGKPMRYIAGRLICAVNVGSALAERGIKGTGSALALSYLHWGRSAGGPVPGAVIVSARRGGGHVAIVSRVENGVVFAWNATGGQSGWREIPYRHHVIDYRVPG